MAFSEYMNFTKCFILLYALAQSINQSFKFLSVIFGGFLAIGPTVCCRLSLSLCRCGGGVAVGVSGAAVGGGCTLWAVWAVVAVEAAPLAALQAFFTAANDHHGQRHNEATLLRKNAEIYHILWG